MTVQENIHQDKTFETRQALWPFLKRIFSYAMRYRNWMFGFAFWVMMMAALDAITPLVFLNLIDHVITPALIMVRENSVQLAWETYSGDLYRYAAYFMGIGTGMILSLYYFIKYAGQVQEFVMTDLRLDMFKKLQRLPFSYYDRNASGWLLSRLTSDTDRVCEVISWGALDAVWGLSLIFFCLGAMFYYDWSLMLIVLVSIPVMVLLSARIRRLVLLYSRKSRKINSELTATYMEHIQGIKETKNFAMENEQHKRFRVQSSAMYGASFKSAFYSATYIPLVIFIGSLAAAFVVWLGGSGVIAGTVTLGTLIAAYEYSTKIFMPMSDLSRFYANAQNSLSAGERIFALLDEPITIKDSEQATFWDQKPAIIKYNDVSFYYRADQPVLNNFSLEIAPGSSVAIIGPTGAGKSTVINLLGRFYEPVSGSVQFNGTDIRDYTLESLRQGMAFISQTPQLFKGSIMQNILFGRSGLTEGEVIEVLKSLSADSLISRLHENVGESGEHLSIGERQLISFARAMVTDPAIIILDEATSSVDTETEAIIQIAMNKMLHGRTAIIIAHRLSTIKNCDQIVVMEAGAIAEQGQHADLISRKGLYYRLYLHQLSKTVDAWSDMLEAE
jgi:ATP-binding cassette, subfamily B, bacterial